MINPFKDVEFRMAPLKKYLLKKEIDTLGLAYIRLIEGANNGSFPAFGANGILGSSDYSPTSFESANKTGRMTISSSLTNATTTMANVSGMSFPVQANKKYSFRFFLQLATSAGGAAPRFQFSGPSSPQAFWFNIKGWESGPSRYEEEVEALDTSTTQASQATSYKTTIVEGNIKTGNFSGNLQLQYKCDAANNSVTIYSNSYGRWHLLEEE